MQACSSWQASANTAPTQVVHEVPSQAHDVTDSHTCKQQLNVDHRVHDSSCSNSRSDCCCSTRIVDGSGQATSPLTAAHASSDALTDFRDALTGIRDVLTNLREGPACSSAPTIASSASPLVNASPNVFMPSGHDARNHAPRSTNTSSAVPWPRASSIAPTPPLRNGSQMGPTAVLQRPMWPKLAAVQSLKKHTEAEPDVEPPPLRQQQQRQLQAPQQQQQQWQQQQLKHQLLPQQHQQEPFCRPLAGKGRQRLRLRGSDLLVHSVASIDQRHDPLQDVVLSTTSSAGSDLACASLEPGGSGSPLASGSGLSVSGSWRSDDGPGRSNSTSTSGSVSTLPVLLSRQPNHGQGSSYCAPASGPGSGVRDSIDPRQDGLKGPKTPHAQRTIEVPCRQCVSGSSDALGGVGSSSHGGKSNSGSEGAGDEWMLSRNIDPERDRFQPESEQGGASTSGRVWQPDADQVATLRRASCVQGIMLARDVCTLHLVVAAWGEDLSLRGAFVALMRLAKMLPRVPAPESLAVDSSGGAVRKPRARTQAVEERAAAVPLAASLAALLVPRLPWLLASECADCVWALGQLRAAGLRFGGDMVAVDALTKRLVVQDGALLRRVSAQALVNLAHGLVRLGCRNPILWARLGEEGLRVMPDLDYGQAASLAWSASRAPAAPDAALVQELATAFAARVHLMKPCHVAMLLTACATAGVRPALLLSSAAADLTWRLHQYKDRWLATAALALARLDAAPDALLHTLARRGAQLSRRFTPASAVTFLMGMVRARVHGGAWEAAAAVLAGIKWRRYNVKGLVALLYCAARLELKETRLLAWVLATLSAQAGLLDTRLVCMSLWALARLAGRTPGDGSGGARAAAAAAASAAAAADRGRALPPRGSMKESAAVWAGPPFTAALDSLCRAAVAQRQGPREAALLAWCLSRLECGESGLLLLECLCQRAAAAPAAAFMPRDLAILASSLARIRHLDPALLDSLAAAAVAQADGLGPRYLAVFIWAFAKLNHYDGPLVEAVRSAAAPRLAAFRSQELANLAAGLQRLEQQPDSAWYRRLAAAVAAAMPEHNLRALSKFAVTFVSSEQHRQHHTLLASMANAVTARLAPVADGVLPPARTYTPHELIRLLWAYSKAGHYHRSMFQLVSAALCLCFSRVCVYDRCVVAAAFARAGIPSPALFDMIAQDVREHGYRYKSEQLGLLKRAYSVLSHPAEDQLMMHLAKREAAAHAVDGHADGLYIRGDTYWEAEEVAGWVDAHPRAS